MDKAVIFFVEGDTEEAFDRLFEATSGIKKNILALSAK